MIKINQIIQEIKEIEDRETKMDYLIECAQRFKEVPERIAKRPFNQEHLVPGCESEAYCWCEKTGTDSFKFYFAVENPQGISAKAFAVILDEGLSGCGLDEIKSVSAEIVYDIFGQNITMGRGQGLINMLLMSQGLAKSLPI